MTLSDKRTGKRFIVEPRDYGYSRCKNKKRLMAQIRGKAPKDVKCQDCDRPFYESDDYIVRGEIWGEAGMRYDSGYLHQSCLEARLGRKLKHKDFLLRFVRYHRKGVEMWAHDDYGTSPEFLKGSGGQ